MRRLIVVPSLVFLFSAMALAFASPAGKYVGTWTGAGGEGAIKIALAPAAAQGEWTADVSFTLGEQDVKCKTVSVKVDGDRLELSYDFTIGALQARSTVIGKIKETTMEGDYTTKGADGSSVDAGTWKVALQK